MKKQHDVHFRHEDMSCHVIKDGKTIAKPFLQDNLWVLDTYVGGAEDEAGSTYLSGGTSISGAALVDAAPARGAGLETWHLRFNHLHEGALYSMARNGAVKGLEIDGGNPVKGECMGCAAGKHQRGSFATVDNRKASDLLELVHTDVLGPVEVRNLDGKERYVLTFVDEFSKRSWIYLLKSRKEVFPSIQNWKHKVENRSSKRVKSLRCDRGGEYVSAETRH